MPQQAHTFEIEITQTVRLPYLLYLPPDYKPDSVQKWPLILFLHGAGERGDDLELVKKHGIPKVVEERQDFPFIAVAPQCPEGEWWPEKTRILSALLDEVMAAYAVDPDLIYLTGLSMGGYGTWSLATAYPERFAALVPICGGGLSIVGFPERACVLKKIPIWVFHGARDEVVRIEESEKMVNALKACGGNVRFTVYPEAEHDSWTETYDNPELYAWLLQQRR
jgi:predicted peptidase